MKILAIRHSIGSIFFFLALIIFILVGFYELILCLTIIYHAGGFWGTLVAFFFFPIVMVFTPIYAIVAYHNWFLFLIGYGVLIPVGILTGIGYLIYGKE